MKNKYQLISIRSLYVHTSIKELFFFTDKKSVIIPQIPTNSRWPQAEGVNEKRIRVNSKLYWTTLKNNPMPGARNVRAWDLGIR